MLFPVIKVNEFLTQSKFDIVYGCRHSLNDGSCAYLMRWLARSLNIDAMCVDEQVPGNLEETVEAMKLVPEELVQKRQQHEQPHKHSNQQQSTRQVKQEKTTGREGEEREKGRKGERKKGKLRKRTKEVKKDVMGWTVVSRSKKQMKRTYQIFVKVDGTPEDKIQKILNTMSGSDQDVFAMCEGRMLRKGDELKSGGVGDGSTTQFVSRLWRGGRHKDKKGEAEKKQVTRQEQVSNESPALL